MTTTKTDAQTVPAIIEQAITQLKDAHPYVDNNIARCGIGSAIELLGAAAQRLVDGEKVSETDCPQCSYNKMKKFCQSLNLDPDAILRKPPTTSEEA